MDVDRIVVNDITLQGALDRVKRRSGIKTFFGRGVDEHAPTSVHGNNANVSFHPYRSDNRCLLARSSPVAYMTLTISAGRAENQHVLLDISHLRRER